MATNTEALTKSVKRRGKPMVTDRLVGTCKMCGEIAGRYPDGKQRTYCTPCDARRVKKLLMKKRIANHGMQAEVASIIEADRGLAERKELLQEILAEKNQEGGK